MRLAMTVIVPPPQKWEANGVSHSSNVREFYAVDRFADQLTKAAGFDVPVIEGSLAEAPKDGFLFVYEDGFPYEGFKRDAFTKLGPRIILMSTGRGNLMSGRRESLVADVYALAGAVEEHDYFLWQTGPGGGRIHGLVSVAERLGLHVGFRSRPSDYAFLLCPDPGHTMGQVFVDYLTAYEEMGLHLRRQSG